MLGSIWSLGGHSFARRLPKIEPASDKDLFQVLCSAIRPMAHFNGQPWTTVLLEAHVPMQYLSHPEAMAGGLQCRHLIVTSSIVAVLNRNVFPLGSALAGRRLLRVSATANCQRPTPNSQLPRIPQLTIRDSRSLLFTTALASCDTPDGLHSFNYLGGLCTTSLLVADHFCNPRYLASVPSAPPVGSSPRLSELLHLPPT
jgi:hypothetical protein